MKEFFFSDNIILENERAVLMPMDQHHINELAGIIEKDTGLMKYASIVLTNETELTQYISIVLQAKQEMTRYPFVIFDKQSGRYAGSTSYIDVSNKHQFLEIGHTWIGYDFQRTGLNDAIKYLMLQYAFDTLGFCRVEFKADSRNTQSRTAIERIGATFEGELRSRIVKPGGFRSSTVFYSILDSEWPVIRQRVFKMTDV